MRRIVPLALALISLPALVSAQVSALSDEFEDAASLADWQRIHLVEGWNADQLETLDIDTTQPGRMFLMPHTVSWYEEWRGPLVYKTVTGNFVVTTHVHPTARDGVSLPATDFSLGGIMVRTPRAITDPSTDWSPGGENYIFLSMGRANNSNGGSFEYEVKTTITSVSNLEIESAPAASSQLQISRIGEYVLALLRPAGGSWTVHRRYHRPDMPPTLQVGLVAYTDWPGMSSTDPYWHNGNVVTGAGTNPDLAVGFDYLRFNAPQVPATLAGVDLTDPVAAPEAELLAFLGDAANSPTGIAPTPLAPVVVRAVAPNPFNPRTRIDLEVAQASQVRVVLHDAAGRRVATLLDARLHPGSHAVTWDGTDAAGAPVASGVYRARVLVDEQTVAQARLVLVR